VKIIPFKKRLAELVLQESAVSTTLDYFCVQEGSRVDAEDFRKWIREFMSLNCGVDIGIQDYHQLHVEIGRVYLGSEYLRHLEKADAYAMLRGHSVEVEHAHYGREEGQHPGMTSDTLLRFGRASEDWHEVLGFRAGYPPMLPLKKRLSLLAQAQSMPSRDKPGNDLLACDLVE